VANDFKKYKGRHAKKVGILFATGPTLNSFDYGFFKKENLKKLIQVGVNSTIYSEDLKLDYYFCGHDFDRDATTGLSSGHPNKGHFPSYLESAASRKLKKIFCATKVNGVRHAEHFRDEDISFLDAIPFETSTKRGVGAFQADISIHPFYNHSIVFPALQFLLYTGVQIIYLVGNDCSGGYSYLFPKISSVYDRGMDDIVPNWRDFKMFVEKSYPNVDIVSINPVKLEKIFMDVYYPDQKK